MQEVTPLRWSGDVPPSLLSSIQEGTFRTGYRGRAFIKSPFDVVLYLQLFQWVRPRTVIEIGTHQGGSALWFADTLSAIGVQPRVLSIDRKPPELDDPRITLIAGDALALGTVLPPQFLESLARPLIVIDDSAHLYDTTLAVLEFFHPVLWPGEYMVIEDGVVSQFAEPRYSRYEDGPNRAIAAFLAEHGHEYDIDRNLCDFYGTNVTFNPNAWLRKRVPPAAAPEPAERPGTPAPLDESVTRGAGPARERGPGHSAALDWSTAAPRPPSAALASLLARAPSQPAASKSGGDFPIPFIVGCPRSGTTLLRLMLDAHPLLTIPLETHFIVGLLDLDPADPELRTRFSREVVQGPRWADFHLDADEFNRRLDAVEPFTIGDGLRVFYRMCADRMGKPRWGDKTPEYGHHMVRIGDLLPAARFVHVIRDGRDVACSLRTMWWDPGEDFEAHANVWLWRVTECRRQGALCPYYYEVRYETLVQEPESTLRKVCQFLELPYSALMLDYHRTAAERMAELGDWVRPDGTTGGSREERLKIHERTQRPPNSERVGRWRSELSARQLATVERVAGSLLTELGYGLSSRSPDCRDNGGGAG